MSVRLGMGLAGFSRARNALKKSAHMQGVYMKLGAPYRRKKPEGKPLSVFFTDLARLDRFDCGMRLKWNPLTALIFRVNQALCGIAVTVEFGVWPIL